MQSVKVVACPQCGAAAPVTPENRWRPFCSERCRLIDLGQWAAEEHRVPGEAAEPDEDATPKPPGS